jgi:prepilin signal peptidase PulO-like enzyme (type II secretory pathway)
MMIFWVAMTFAAVGYALFDMWDEAIFVLVGSINCFLVDWREEWKEKRIAYLEMETAKAKAFIALSGMKDANSSESEVNQS